MASQGTEYIVSSPGTGALADGEIIRRWSSLEWDIRQWALRHEHAVTIPSSGRESSPLNVQAAIWHTLVNHLLPTTTKPQGTVSWDVKSGTVKDLKKKAQLFVQAEKSWVAHTASPGCLAPLAPRKDEIEQKVNQLRTHSAAFLLLLKGDNSNLNKTAIRSLEEIFRAAIQLQIDLALQMPWWYCEYPQAQTDSGASKVVGTNVMKFNPEFMATPSNAAPPSKGRGDTVTLVVSPALIKRGDHPPRGQDANIRRVVEKSQVVCGKPRAVIKPSRTGKPAGAAPPPPPPREIWDESDSDEDPDEPLPRKGFGSIFSWLF
ncbi:hypothetical protein QBC44DRAFT_383101 [Cladorrhinum sp. PSN332]|nr:hypothetical protein QBC44DRAFT_383101 [Cladorrhinum sp. PSN332]